MNNKNDSKHIVILLSCSSGLGGSMCDKDMERYNQYSNKGDGDTIAVISGNNHRTFEVEKKPCHFNFIRKYKTATEKKNKASEKDHLASSLSFKIKFLAWTRNWKKKVAQRLFRKKKKKCWETWKD